MDFIAKTCQTDQKQKKNITFEFYVFEIVEVPNFRLN